MEPEDILIAIWQTPAQAEPHGARETAFFKGWGIKAKDWDGLKEEVKENARKILKENSEFLIRPELVSEYISTMRLIGCSYWWGDGRDVCARRAGGLGDIGREGENEGIKVRWKVGWEGRWTDGWEEGWERGWEG